MGLTMSEVYLPIKSDVILKALLRRLQTDYVELYQMHHVDRNVPGMSYGKLSRC